MFGGDFFVDLATATNANAGAKRPPLQPTPDVQGVHRPQHRYWSDEPILHDASVAGVMPRHRYEKLVLHFHCSIPGNEDARDKPAKVRPLLHICDENFHRCCCVPTRDLSPSTGGCHESSTCRRRRNWHSPSTRAQQGRTAWTWTSGTGWWCSWCVATCSAVTTCTPTTTLRPSTCRRPAARRHLPVRADARDTARVPEDARCCPRVGQVDERWRRDVGEVARQAGRPHDRHQRRRRGLCAVDPT